MLISFRRVGVPALLAGIAASCITFPTGRTVALDPLLLEDRGEVVFDQ